MRAKEEVLQIAREDLEELRVNFRQERNRNWRSMQNILLMYLLFIYMIVFSKKVEKVTI